MFQQTRLFFLLTVLAMSYVMPAPTPAVPLMSQREVLAVTQRVSLYARGQYAPQVEAFWEDGVYHIGQSAAYTLTDNVLMLTYTEKFGNFNQWQLDRAGSGNNHNRLVASQSWMDTWAVVPTVASLTDTRAEILQQTTDSLATVTTGAYHSVDSQFMALPAFARLGAIDNTTVYHERMYELFAHTKTTLGLYDTTDHLYYRDVTYIYPGTQSPNGLKVFWSRGNGWAFAALARVLTFLPVADPHRGEYLTTFQDMAAALKNVQRADGFWNVNLADPNHYPGPETSGTALFVYGMAWGINQGLLDPGVYRPVVETGWHAIVSTALHPNGKVGYVQPPGSNPASGQPVTVDSTSDFGVGVVLLAASEVWSMATNGYVAEVEALSTTVSSGDSQGDAGETSIWGAIYNQATLNAVGDKVEYLFTVPAPGTYAVKVRFRTAPSYGQWQFWTAGANRGAVQEGYSSSPSYTEIDLGTVTYSAFAQEVFRFTVTGKHLASTSYGVAIDYVMLVKQL